jgi:Ni/Co efflux regulator RcnB
MRSAQGGAQAQPQAQPQPQPQPQQRAVPTRPQAAAGHVRGTPNAGGERQWGAVQARAGEPQQDRRGNNGGNRDNWRSNGGNPGAQNNRPGFAGTLDRHNPRDRRDPSDHRGWNDNHGNAGAWNKGWRNDRRYDWRGYRASNRAQFRGPRYFAPRGMSYRRYTPGYRLQPFFYAEQYWIDDPYDYRLPPAYGPYRWVRYFDDVLLVDIRTGTVVDVISDFFY